jgi:WD40 repeat protein
LKELRSASGFSLASVAFSPGGTQIAAGDTFGDGYLWDAATGREVTQLDFPTEAGGFVDPTMVAFSPDSNVVAFASSAGIVLSSASTGRELRRVPGSRDRDFGGLAFSPDGRLLAAGVADGAEVWSVASLHRLMDLSSGRCPGSTGLAISPDGRLLATGASDTYSGAACVWDLTSGKLSEVYPDPAGFQIDAVAFSPHGERLASGENGEAEEGDIRPLEILIWNDGRA